MLPCFLPSSTRKQTQNTTPSKRNIRISKEGWGAKPHKTSLSQIRLCFFFSTFLPTLLFLFLFLSSRFFIFNISVFCKSLFFDPRWGLQPSGVLNDLCFPSVLKTMRSHFGTPTPTYTERKYEQKSGQKVSILLFL